jgi:hypothetical protein
MQDLINNHKPAASENPIFPNIGLAASPPRSNIFSAPNPINNPFTGGPITSPAIMTPNTLPIPILKQPPQPPPPTAFTAFPMNNNNPNNGFPPSTLSSFFPPAGSPGFQGVQNQGGYNSSGSSSGGIVAPPPSFTTAFPAMGPTGQSFSKNLFMDQTGSEEGSIFGGKPSSGGSTNAKAAALKNKKPQIRIS